MRIWDAFNGKELLKLSHDAPVIHAEFSKDEAYILAATIDHTARLWDVATGKTRLTIPNDDQAGNDSIYRVSWSKDEKRLLTWSVYNKLGCVWNVADGKLLFTLSSDSGFAEMQWSSDETRILTASLLSIGVLC